MTMATRCPACGTVFRVVPDQLRVSAGWVRCGRCGEAFDAAATLIDLDGHATAARPAAPAPGDEGLVASNGGGGPAGDIATAGTVATAVSAAASTGESPRESDRAAAPPAESNRADEVAEALRRDDDAAVAAIVEDAAEAAPAPSGDALEALAAAGHDTSQQAPEVVDASEATDPTDATDATDAADAAAAQVGSPAASTAEPSPPPAATTGNDPTDERDGRPSMAPRKHDVVASATNVDPETSVEPATNVEPAANVEAGHDTSVAPSFLRRAERAERWRSPKVRAVLACGVVAAALALVGQAAVLHGDWVAAKLPAVRPWLAQACSWVGCDVGEYRQIEALSVESSGLVRVEGTALYRLSVVLRNRAALEIAAPSIDLTLTDAQGQLIARRVLALPDLGIPLRTLKAGAEVPVQASLAVGERAVSGYTVEIFYP